VAGLDLKSAETTFTFAASSAILSAEEGWVLRREGSAWGCVEVNYKL
jgi:hypothetical protein